MEKNSHSDIKEIIYKAQTKADKLFNKGRFYEAKKLYLETLKSNNSPDFQALIYNKLALCSQQMNMHDKELMYYQKIVNEGIAVGVMRALIACGKMQS